MKCVAGLGHWGFGARTLSNKLGANVWTASRRPRVLIKKRMNVSCRYVHSLSDSRVVKSFFFFFLFIVNNTPLFSLRVGKVGSYLSHSICAHKRMFLKVSSKYTSAAACIFSRLQRKG